MGRLHELPIELLHHVARYCSPHDILALASSCRSLRDAYNNGVVFRQSFEYAIPPVSSRSIANKKALVASITKQLDRLVETENIDRADECTSFWRYLAVMASRLKLIGDLDSQVSALHRKLKEADSHSAAIDISVAIMPLKKTVELLTTSVVWGCLSVCDDTLVRGCEGLCLLVYTEQTSDPVAQSLLGSFSDLEAPFCLAICAIQGFQVSPIHHEDIGDMEEQNVLSHILETSLAGLFFRDDDTLVTIPRGLALLLCAVAAGVSSNGKKEHPLLEDIPFLSQKHTQSSPDSLVPLMANIERMEGPPLPAATMPHNDPDRCFTPILACGWRMWFEARSKALIDDIEIGEWEGLYTYGYDIGTSRVDPAMQRIRFRKVSEVENRVGISATNCIDGIGAFRLDGHLDLETCDVVMRKTYVGSHHFDWRGKVTALGIIGCYLASWGLHSPIGAFWLWNCDWKRGDPKSRDGSRP